MSGVRERVLAEVDASRDEEVGLLRALIAAQQDGEAAVQAIVADRLEAIGAKVEFITYRPADVPLVGEFAAEQAIAAGDRVSVVGRLEGSGTGRSLMFFAHPDGEPIAATQTWTHDPFAGVVANGRLHGWGVADDLLGVAAALTAVSAVAKAGVRPGGAIIVASTPSKRHARGVSAMMQHGFTADAAVYLHPAESGVGLREIKAFASGQLEFRITVTGRQPATTEPGHTIFAHRAVNPIDKAFLVCSALQALDARRAAAVHHPVLDAAVGRSTNLQVSAIACGEESRLSRLNLSCTIGGAVSFPPNERMQDVQAQIETAIADVANGDPWLRDHPPTLEWISGVTGMEIAEDHPLYRTVSAAVTAVTGITPSINPLHTSSDIRNPIVQRSIPTVGLGPRCGNLTQVGGIDEWVDVDDYIDMIKVAATIAMDWTGATS